MAKTYCVLERERPDHLGRSYFTAFWTGWVGPRFEWGMRSQVFHMRLSDFTRHTEERGDRVATVQSKDEARAVLRDELDRPRTAKGERP